MIPGQWLTEPERRVVALLGEAYTLLDEQVVGDGPTRAGDLLEARGHVHALQHAVMAQAAGRAYPAEFRLLGGVVEDTGRT